jgi:uncharacterized membrane protein YbhN (UPF0104 family)
MVVRGARWKVLLAGQGIRPSFAKILETLLVATFFNQLLPSTIGGDLVRSHRMARLLESRDSGTLMLAVVGVDRVVGVVGTVLVALLAAALSPSIVEGLPEFWLVLGLVASGLVLVGLLGSPLGRQAGRALFSIRLLSRLRDKAAIVHGTLASYRDQKTRLAATLILSMALQGLVILEYVLFAKALGLGVSARALGIIIPIVTMIEMAPVTVGGIGLREGALSVLGSSVGLRPQDAIALAWLFLGTALSYAVAGWLTYTVRRPRRSSSAEQGLTRSDSSLLT